MIINPKTKERVINHVNAFIYGDKVFVKQTAYGGSNDTLNRDRPKIHNQYRLIERS